MATVEEEVRAHLISKIVENVPRDFLEEIWRRAPRAYRDKFQEVRLDPTTIKEQRLSKLIQDRVFRMDWELAEAAKAHELVSTSKPLPENGWAYTYVIAGSFGLTQSYVPAIGALPKPAKFREGLASASGVPRLPLDDPSEIYAVKDFYALIANNPVGRFFTEEHQQLGSLQFCIPSKDMDAWAFSMGVPELIAQYPVPAKRSDERRDPTWKKRPEEGSGS